MEMLRVCLFLSLATAALTTLPYQCGSFGCGTGDTCVSTTGDCTCDNNPTAEYGPYCKAGVPCANQALCSDPGTAKDVTPEKVCETANGPCICAKGYYGTYCEIPRVTAVCDSNTVTVRVEPYEKADGNPYPGTITLGLDEADLLTSTCELDHTTTDTQTVTYDPSNGGGACDKALTAGVAASGNSKYIYVGFRAAAEFKLASDATFKIDCDPDTNGGEATAAIGFNVNIGNSVQEETHAEKDGVIMDVYTWNSVTSEVAAITDDVLIGTELKIVIQHPDKFAVHTCKTDSQATYDNTDGAGFIFYEKLCVSDPYHQLFYDNVAYTAKTAITTPEAATAAGVQLGHNFATFSVNAWQFPSSGSIYLWCDICFSEACKATLNPTLPCTENIPLTEDYITNSYTPDLDTSTRRRRQATDSASINATSLMVQVVVRTPGQDDVIVDVAKDPSSEDSDCYKSISVLLPIILLAILLLVAMVMTFFFCMKLTRDREIYEGKTNPAYKS